MTRVIGNDFLKRLYRHAGALSRGTMCTLPLPGEGIAIMGFKALLGVCDQLRGVWWASLWRWLKRLISQWNVKCNVICFTPCAGIRPKRAPQYYTHSRLCVTVRAISWTSGHNIGHFHTHTAIIRWRSHTSDFLWRARSRRKKKKILHNWPCRNFCLRSNCSCRVALFSKGMISTQ